MQAAAAPPPDTAQCKVVFASYVTRVPGTVLMAIGIHAGAVKICKHIVVELSVPLLQKKQELSVPPMGR
jgi:hypothetical protein